MNRSFSFVLCFSLSATVPACQPAPQPDGRNHYHLEASLIQSEGLLEASAEISFSTPTPGIESAQFYLHRQLAVSEVSGPLVSHFQFDPSEPASAPWLPEAGTLHVTFSRPLREGEKTELHIEYAGRITEWPTWSANVITEEWVELGLYLPWFPYNFDDFGPFTFDVDFATDSAYEVRGYGTTVRTGEGWHIERTFPANDIVVVASKELETLRLDGEGGSVQLHNPGLDDSTTTGIASSALLALGTYEGWFGPADERDVTVIASKRELGGGYARPGLIVLTKVTGLNAPGRRADFFRFLGHEIGHLWWRRAATNSWEDWLNESFAEYSALLLLREEFGAAEFQTRLERKRTTISGTAPIWEFDRSDTSTELARSEVAAILYDKGPLLLNDLVARIGLPAFFDWCRTLSSREVKTTDAAVSLLREQTDTETSEWFENALKER